MKDLALVTDTYFHWNIPYIQNFVPQVWVQDPEQLGGRIVAVVIAIAALPNCAICVVRLWSGRETLQADNF